MAITAAQVARDRYDDLLRRCLAIIRAVYPDVGHDDALRLAQRAAAYIQDAQEYDT